MNMKRQGMHQQHYHHLRRLKSRWRWLSPELARLFALRTWLVNNKFTEITRKNFNKLQKSRLNMNNLFSRIHKTAEQFPVDFVGAFVEDTERCYRKRWW
jgi:hypothetical protein